LKYLSSTFWKVELQSFWSNAEDLCNVRTSYSQPLLGVEVVVNGHVETCEIISENMQKTPMAVIRLQSLTRAVHRIFAAAQLPIQQNGWRAGKMQMQSEAIVNHVRVALRHNGGQLL
jgi:hypothetical protein